MRKRMAEMTAEERREITRKACEASVQLTECDVCGKAVPKNTLHIHRHWKHPETVR
jgi:hypothetical protein